MLGLTDKPSNVTMVHAKVNVAGRTTTAPIGARVNVTATRPVRCVRHHAKSNADTRNAPRNAKSPARHALRIAHGHVHTVDAIRCLAPYPAVFFHVPKGVGKDLAVAISVHRYAVKSALHLSIARYALPKLSKVLW